MERNDHFATFSHSQITSDKLPRSFLVKHLSPVDRQRFCVCVIMVLVIRTSS